MLRAIAEPVVIERPKRGGSAARAPGELVKCKRIGVEVLAEAEFMLEGEIFFDVDERPYGEYSTDRSTRNVFMVNALTSRDNPS